MIMKQKLQQTQTPHKVHYDFLLMSSCYRSSADQSFNHRWSTFSYSAPLPLLTEPTKGASITPSKPKFQLYLRSAWSPRSAAPAGTSSCWCSSDSPWCCLHSLPDFPLWSSWKGKKSKAARGKITFFSCLGKMLLRGRLEQSLALNISPVYKRHTWFSLHEKFRLSSLNNKK